MGKQAERAVPAPTADTVQHAGSASAAAAIRVVLLTDLPIVARGLESLIEGRRPAVSLVGVARTTEEALRLMKDHPADILLLDLDGDVDGQGISELLDGGRTRVLALTTSRDPEFCDAAVLAGASGVLNKRDANEALLKAIEKVHGGEFWLDRVATGRIFVAIARQRSARDPEQVKIARLTRKERLTVSEMARNAAATSREIAQRLCISEHTLRNHLTSIYSKLGLRGRMELFVYANKHKLVAAGGVRPVSPAPSGADAPQTPDKLQRVGTRARPGTRSAARD